MESLFHSSVFTTALLVAAIIIAAIIVYKTIKGLLKLVALIITFLLIYAGYLFLTGQKIPFTREEIIKHGNDRIKILKEYLPEAKKPARK